MMLLTDHEKNSLEHYKNIKERVFFIYNKSQEAVDCNKRLLYYYKKLFGEDNLCEESITRAGRYWRNSTIKGKRKTFNRSEDIMRKDEELEGINKWIWGAES